MRGEQNIFLNRWWKHETATNKNKRRRKERGKGRIKAQVREVAQGLGGGDDYKYILGNRIFEKRRKNKED